MKIYLTSDEHYFHRNIIKYCKRPFKNEIIMNKELIKLHNSVVTEEDFVFHLGDFTLSKNKNQVEEIFKKLNGTHSLILGNHDRLNPFDYIEIGFESVHTSLKFNYRLIDIYFNHDPAIFQDLNKLSACGHVHGQYKKFNSIINVGVDVWDFKPVLLDEVIELSYAI